MEDRYLVERRNFIHNRRLELGKTLEEIGAVVGVSKGTVQRWESGNISNMRRDKIAKLAEALEVSPAQLLGWDDEPAPDAPSPALTPAESILLADFRRLNDRGQNEALFQLRHLAETDEYKKSPAAGSLPAAR